MSDEINIKTKSKKTKLFIIIAAVVIAFFTVGAVIFAMSKSATARKVEKQLSLGEKYLSELDYEQAIVAYELAIEIDPKNAESYIGLADVYVAMGDYEKAEEILEKAKERVDEDEVRQIKEKLKEVKQKKDVEVKPMATPTPELTNTHELTPTLKPIKEPEEITDISWFEYEETENGNIRIVGLKAGAPEKIVVPGQIEGKKVTEIMDYAFFSCDLTEVFLPASIEKIGYGAMGWNSRLKSINIAEENKDFMVKNGVLFSMDGTELIQVPGGFEEKSYSIPDGTVKVKHKAFSYCTNLSNIIIAESVKEIESTAFEGCYSLVEIRIPKGVEKIEESPFSYCDALEKIEVDEENQYYSSYNGALYNKEKTELIQLPRKIDTEVYKIIDGVKVIGHSACIATDYVGIDLPEGLETIRHGAFWGTKMKEIQLPEGLRTIESCSFAYCDLNKVEIPASVTFINYDAFIGAPNVIIYTTKGSYADTYAQENDIPVSYK